MYNVYLLPPQTKASQNRQSTVNLASKVLLIAIFFVLQPMQALFAQSTPVDVGYKDHNFGSAPDPAITGEKPQSKIWYNDNLWWGSMWNPSASTYEIYQFDFNTQSWTSTGVAIDNRAGTKADCLWDGVKLYVASQNFTTSGGPTSQANAARLYRYSYNAATKTYSLDAGFPVTINNSESETLVLDKDSTGKLWITWMEDGDVWINRSLADDLTWGTPFLLPGQGSSAANDDISSVITFDVGKIGVMWSDQVDAKIYFMVHLDGDADLTWQPLEEALADAQLSGAADDHVNLKAACDNTGNIYAVTKSSHTGPNDPRIYVLKRDNTGNWTDYVFSTRQNKHTRPILVIDIENQDMYVFAKDKGNFGDAIFYKKTSLSNIQFDDDDGIIFIESQNDENINNPTTTKQCLTGAMDLMVLAADDVTLNYFHNTIDLPDNAPPTPPTITSTPNTTTNYGLPYAYDSDNTINVTGSLPITFSFTGPPGFSVDPNTGLVSWTPTFADVGAHSISVTATNSLGSDTQNFNIQVDPFAVRINAGSATAYTDANGDLFVADQAYSAGNFGYVAGNQISFSTPIIGTNDDPLFQTLRGHKVSFQYKFDVPATGFYDVTLYLAAPVFGTGNFIMDVLAEGNVALNDFDIESQAGGTFNALVTTISVNVTDGTLDLDFQTVNKASILNAIAVVPGSAPTPTPDIDVAPLTLNFNQVIVGQSSDMSVTISNTGAANLTVNAINIDNGEFSLVSPPVLPLTIAPSASQNLTVRFSPTVVASQAGNLDILSDDPDEGTVTIALQGQGISQPVGDVFRINAGGASSFTDSNGDIFVADQAYTAGSYGYTAGQARNVTSPVGGTTDDPLYQNIRSAPTLFDYKFDVSSASTFDVTLYFTAPVYKPSSGNFIMDISAEGIIVFDDLDLETEAGGTNQALTKTFTVSVSDGTLDIDFQMVNKAVIVSAIAVVEQTVAPNLAKRDSQEEVAETIPNFFQLYQNYPNPFNPETRIRFDIPSEMYVTLKIYNLLGEEVRTLVDGFQQSGSYSIRWDTRNNFGALLPSGMYLYRLQGRGFVSVRDMALLR